MTDDDRTLAGLWGVDRLLDTDETLDHPIPGSTITVMFDGERVMGNAGCNSFRGSCTVEGSEMALGTIATTQRLCLRPPGVMEQEARFLALLERIAAYSFGDGGLLTLLDDADTAIVELSRSEEDDLDA